MKIYAPVKGFDGLRNGVRFVRGVGETDNTALLSWFQSRGYCVEDDSQVAEIDKPIEAEVVTNKLAPLDLPNLDDMDAVELRQWALDNGYGVVIRNTRNKDKLLELIKNN